MIKAIIFDLDGVLVDATEWHYEALNKALAIFGFTIKREDHLNLYNGLPTTEKLKIMSQNNHLPVGLHEVIKKLKRKYTDEIIKNQCHPDHGKQLLLNRLKNEGYKLVCCSNAQRYSVDNMLKFSQLYDYFDLIIGNDEGYAPKPSPDIYLAAFQKLGVEPSESIIIEDAPHGIEAAKASGAQVIAVRGYNDVNLSLFLNLNLINLSPTLSANHQSKTHHLNQFKGGWFIGNFEPSLLKSQDFEVAVKKYKSGEREVQHYHKIATEYTIFINGSFRMNGQEYRPSDIVITNPGQSTDFECLADGTTLVVKVPSVKNDKYLTIPNNGQNN